MGTGNPVHDFGLADGHAERHAGGDAFGGADDVGLHAGVLDGPPFSGASDTTLDFIGDQQDAVTIADTAEFLHEHGGSDYVSTFALNRLDEDCGYFLGGKRGFEELVFDEAGATQRESFGILRSAFASAIHVGIANVGYAWKHGTETALLLRLGSSQRKRSHSASVERAVECDHVLPLGVIAGEFEGALDGLRSRVAVVDLVRPRHGRDLREALGEGHHVFVIEVGAGHVDQFGCLLLNGGDHLGMAMAGRGDGDAGREIEKFISVDVGDSNSVSLFGDERIGAGVGR